MDLSFGIATVASRVHNDIIIMTPLQ